MAGEPSLAQLEDYLWDSLILSTCVCVCVWCIPQINENMEGTSFVLLLLDWMTVRTFVDYYHFHLEK